MLLKREKLNVAKKQNKNDPFSNISDTLKKIAYNRGRNTPLWTNTHEIVAGIVIAAIFGTVAAISARSAGIEVDKSAIFIPVGTLALASAGLLLSRFFNYKQWGELIAFSLFVISIIIIIAFAIDTKEKIVEIDPDPIPIDSDVILMEFDDLSNWAFYQTIHDPENEGQFIRVAEGTVASSPSQSQSEKRSLRADITIECDDDTLEAPTFLVWKPDKSFNADVIRGLVYVPSDEDYAIDFIQVCIFTSNGSDCGNSTIPFNANQWATWEADLSKRDVANVTLNEADLTQFYVQAGVTCTNPQQLEPTVTLYLDDVEID